MYIYIYMRNVDRRNFQVDDFCTVLLHLDKRDNPQWFLGAVRCVEKENEIFEIHFDDGEVISSIHWYQMLWIPDLRYNEADLDVIYVQKLKQMSSRKRRKV